MKEKLCTLGTLLMILLICAAGVNAQGPRPLLGKTITGQNATSDITVNATLDPAFILSGVVSSPAGITRIAVIATSATTGTLLSRHLAHDLSSRPSTVNEDRDDENLCGSDEESA